MQDFLIMPSILSADLARLGEDVAKVIDAGADGIHFDVMDNHYVPNLTFGAHVCKALRSYGITAPIDVHLMVSPTDRIIPDFAEAGATIINFHIDASTHIDRSIKLIKSLGCQAGVVLNPATPLSTLDYVLEDVDNVLIMSVNPGFGGQSFISSALTKIVELRKKIDKVKPEVRLSVDGGIKLNNIKEVAKAGANMLVAGSAVFDHSNYEQIISAMRAELASIKA